MASVSVWEKASFVQALPACCNSSSHCQVWQEAGPRASGDWRSRSFPLPNLRNCRSVRDLSAEAPATPSKYHEDVDKLLAPGSVGAEAILFPSGPHVPRFLEAPLQIYNPGLTPSNCSSKCTADLQMPRMNLAKWNRERVLPQSHLNG